MTAHVLGYSSEEQADARKQIALHQRLGLSVPSHLRLIAGEEDKATVASGPDVRGLAVSPAARSRRTDSGASEDELAPSGKPARPPMPDLTDLGFDSLAGHIPEPARWLGPTGFVRDGELNVLGSLMKMGKTRMVCRLAADITNGSPWPTDDSLLLPQGAVLYATYEESKDSLTRKLRAAGADTNYVVILGTEGLTGEGQPRDLGIDLSKVDSALHRARAAGSAFRLVVIESKDFLGEGVNTNRDEEIRPHLIGLQRLAREYDVAVLLVVHLNKKTYLDAVQRFSGGAGWTAVPRQLLRIEEDPNDKASRVLLARGNEASDFALRFTFAPVAVETTEGRLFEATCIWLGEAPYGFDDLPDKRGPGAPRRPAEPTKKERLAGKFKELLPYGSGAMASDVLEAAGRDLGFPVTAAGKTADDAKSLAGIESEPLGRERMWYRPWPGIDGGSPAPI